MNEEVKDIFPELEKIVEQEELQADQISWLDSEGKKLRDSILKDGLDLKSLRKRPWSQGFQSYHLKHGSDRMDLGEIGKRKSRDYNDSGVRFLELDEVVYIANPEVTYLCCQNNLPMILKGGLELKGVREGMDSDEFFNLVSEASSYVLKNVREKISIPSRFEGDSSGHLKEEDGDFGKFKRLFHSHIDGLFDEAYRFSINDGFVKDLDLKDKDVLLLGSATSSKDSFPKEGYWDSEDYCGNGGCGLHSRNIYRGLYERGVRNVLNFGPSWNSSGEMFSANLRKVFSDGERYTAKGPKCFFK